MTTAPALLVLRGLRADAAALLAAWSHAEDPSRGRALLCAASGELTELAVAHVRSGRDHALAALPRDAAVRAAAQLHDLQRWADGTGDAAAVLVSAGLSGGAREQAAGALARRLAGLAAVLPSDVERRAPGWDTAALQCSGPRVLVLGSALRRVEEVPAAWQPAWEQMQPELHRSALHRVVSATSG